MSDQATPSRFYLPILFSCILILLGCEVWIASQRQFNWDEYFYLSKVYRYTFGEFDSPFQNFHVHFFGWLPSLDDIHEQLVAGRLVMVVAQAATCASIYFLARRFTSTIPALIAVIAYLACGTTLSQGASFRADPLGGAFAMSALAVIATMPQRLTSIFVATVLAGLALLVTVKAIFFAPAWMAFGLDRVFGREGRGWRDLRALASLALGLIAVGGIFALHAHALGGANAAQGAATLDAAGNKVLFEAGLLPRADRIFRASIAALPQTIAVVVAIALILRLKIQRRIGGEFWLLAAAATPLLSLLFYRNAFLYFFPFITPSAMILIAWLVQSLGPDKKVLTHAFLVFLALAGTIGVARALDRTQDVQRDVISAVHEVFPEPVYVIDRNGMIADFPREMFFMSTWGLEDYQNGPPFAKQYLAQRTVPLLLANSASLEDALGIPVRVRPENRLQEQDRHLLRDNYIQHWGPIWVAGKRLVASPDAREFSIHVPGPYTLEGGPVVIDGSPIAPNETISLRRGVHTISAEQSGQATLRWGTRLPRPDRAPPQSPLYDPGGV